MEEKYEEMVDKLNHLVTENGETFKSLDEFAKKLRSCCDKYADWRGKAEKELDNPLPLGKENETAATVPVNKIHQKTLALVEMERLEPTNQFTKILHGVSKAFQETLDGKPETFIKNFKAAKASTSSKTEAAPLEFSFSSRAENSPAISATNSTTGVDGLSASSAAKSSLFGGGFSVGFGGSSPTNAKLTKNLTYISGGKWVIRNDSEVATACKVLTDHPLVNPSDVSIVVCDIVIEKQFEELLSLIARRTCSVSLKSLYSHWKSVPESEVTAATRTQSRIRSLFNSNFPVFITHRCTLTEYWGYLDVDCVKILPKTLKSIGLVLAGEKDVDVLTEFMLVDYGRWIWNNKWTSLNNLHIAVSKTFQPEWWNVRQKIKPNRSSTGFSCVPPEPVPQDSSKSRTVLKVSLHFPKLVSEEDLDWMKLILGKIKDSHMEIGSLTDMYLPGLLISYTKVHDALKSCGLDTDLALLTVHLPIDAKNIFSVETKEEMGNCTFTWDMAKI